MRVCGVTTPVTPVTAEKINTEAHTINELLLCDLLTAAPTEPKRLFSKRGPWLSDTVQSAAEAYHAHHFNCPTCIAVGRGAVYGLRCGTGMALSTYYQNT